MQSREKAPVRLYQPIWCNGSVNGYYPYQRDCAERYEVVKQLASKFNRPFSVLDVGSSYGYFDVRLMEDFPEAVCVLIDNKEVVPVLKENLQLDRSVVVKRKITAAELEALSLSESFDIVLGLSVLHHFDDPFRAYNALRRLGWWSVFEVPGIDDLEAAFPERHGLVRDLFFNSDARGYFQSHTGSPRPYYVLENVPFIDEQSIDAADRDAPGYLRYALNVDFDKATFEKDGLERPFIPGMNLHNFLRLGGGWPTSELIDQECRQYVGHPDCFPWNFILGRGITPIDMERK